MSVGKIPAMPNPTPALRAKLSSSDNSSKKCVSNNFEFKGKITWGLAFLPVIGMVVVKWIFRYVRASTNSKTVCELWKMEWVWEVAPLVVAICIYWRMWHECMVKKTLKTTLTVVVILVALSCIIFLFNDALNNKLFSEELSAGIAMYGRRVLCVLLAGLTVLFCVFSIRANKKAV